ncbi:hypothetical protein A2332_01025 [Candidatus Uhrbacteria bacterium RIFOXYB2_FULL_41_18]|nr:MAG: hypothetical protein UT94_C0056G0006 [Candidatus Uhrbacteria bacterium GW2011_GWF2_40_263]OGL96543.1 MAG: hypothetical protein A2332_01025 [Candidatus Uhrbacteria bacterium RIFOXYB2_FULL_41_18]
MKRVLTSFSYDPQGCKRVAYATDLAKRLGRKLIIFLPNGVDKRLTLTAQVCGRSEFELLTFELQYIHSYLRQQGIVMEDVVVEFKRDSLGRCVFKTSDMIVSHDFSVSQSLTVLFPRNESSVFARGEGPLMIPFGVGPTALQVLSSCLPLIKIFGQPVLFYHTTWEKKGMSSSQPRDHMCRAAYDVLAQLCAKAHAEGIAYGEYIEKVSFVESGIVRAALEQGVSLLIMGRAKDVGRGSYVDQVLERSPIPVLVMGSKVLS